MGVELCLHPGAPFVSKALGQRWPTELLELMKTDYNLRQSSATLQLSILKERYPASKQNWSIWIQVHRWEETATKSTAFTWVARFWNKKKKQNGKFKCIFGEIASWILMLMTFVRYADQIARPHYGRKRVCTTLAAEKTPGWVFRSQKVALTLV